MIAMQTIGIVRNWPRSLVTFHYRFSREDGRGDRGDCPLPAKLGPYGHPPLAAPGGQFWPLLHISRTHQELDDEV